MDRLREKLDDDLPELIEELVSLLWPHYLRTIPSLLVGEQAVDHRQIMCDITETDYYTGSSGMDAVPPKP